MWDGQLVEPAWLYEIEKDWERSTDNQTREDRATQPLDYWKDEFRITKTIANNNKNYCQNTDNIDKLVRCFP